MSGVLKGIGKAFKKIVKVVKKIALPVLAIAAVVITGGAALGVLPAIGSIGASLGLSAGLTSVLSSAASAATFGALGSAVTGGNIIKGATTGFVTGGVLGGLGAALAKPLAAVGTGAAGGGIGGGAVVAPAAQAAQATQLGGFAKAAGQTLAGLPTSAPLAASAGLPGGGGGGFLGGLGSFVERNPLLAGQVIQGIGSGLGAAQAAKEDRKNFKRLGENYADTSGLFRLSDDDPSAVGIQGQRYDQIINGKVRYDRRTGRLYADGG